MVDPENLEAQIAAVRAIEKDYYAIRKQLVEELSKDALHRDFTSFLRMLESDPVSSRAQILAAGELYDRLDQDLAEGEGSPLIRFQILKSGKEKIRDGAEGSWPAYLIETTRTKSTVRHEIDEALTRPWLRHHFP